MCVRACVRARFSLRGDGGGGGDHLTRVLPPHTVGWLVDAKAVRGPHLVIVPLSTTTNWLREFAKWCPGVRTLLFHGDGPARATIMKGPLVPGLSREERGWDVVVTTYEVARMPAEARALARIGWEYLIVDEARTRARAPRCAHAPSCVSACCSCFCFFCCWYCLCSAPPPHR